MSLYSVYLLLQLYLNTSKALRVQEFDFNLMYFISHFHHPASRGGVESRHVSEPFRCHLWLLFTWLSTHSVCAAAGILKRRSFSPFSWQSCDCHCDLPVTSPQEGTLLDYNAERWAACTLEPEGHTICSVCTVLFTTTAAVFC